MAITDILNVTPQLVAEQNPELHQMRKIAFGENYLSDIEQGTGTSQYYSGWGNVPNWTQQADAAAQGTQIVDTPGGEITVNTATGNVVEPGGAGITGIDLSGGGAQNPLTQIPAGQTQTVKQLMTSPQAYNIPGTMPLTPVSGAWGPQEYFQDQGPRVTLPSGDIFAADDPMLAEKMDYTPTAESQSAWEKVQSGLGNIGDFIKTHGQTAANFFMNAVQPGLNLLGQMLPQESPIDRFNREYQLGGDLYENVVSQVDDPKFEGRLEGYGKDLIAGTGEGKDPFGINTVSAYGDYPDYATKTYNELIEKQKQRATEDKELVQFDKDRLDYYGHVSGLTGKTNIPGTPLMVDDSPLKTFPGGDIIPPEKPEAETYAEKAEEAWKDIIEVQTIAGNDVYVNKITGEVFPSAAELISAAEADQAATGVDQTVTGRDQIMDMVEPEATTMDSYIGPNMFDVAGPVDEDLIDRAGTDIRIQPEEEGLIADKQMAMEFERQQIAQQEEMERAARAREEAAVRASLEAAQRAEEEQRARNREEAAQRDREDAANRVAAQQAAAQAAAAKAAADRMAQERGGGGGGGGFTAPGGGGYGPWRAEGGLIRKPYGKGGIVDLL